MTAKLFGTDGIRGIANADLTPEIAFRLGEAIVHFLADGDSARFVIGRDTRQSGTMLQSALVAGITSAGGDALLCRIVPTPAIAYLVREMGADGGIVISASHNAPQYNGIKIFSRQGFKLPDELEDEIEEFLVSKTCIKRPIGAGVGSARMVRDGLERYIDHAVSIFEPDCLKGLRIAIDCGHGASAISSPSAFIRLGAEVTAINTDHDGNDINVGCGSTHLGPIAEMMRTGAFDLGIAHDGDADRVLAVDENGDVVDGDRIMAVCAKYMHEQGTLAADTVVSTVMCNLGFEVAMRDLGINVIKTKVGDRYVLEQMQAMNANLGGEQSGHVILLDHNTTGDGLVTALLLAKVMKHTGQKLSELAAVMTTYPQVLVNVPVGKKGHLAASAVIARAIEAAEERLGESGRVLVRASGTEPLVRVMAEAQSQEVAQDVVDGLVGIVESELG